MLSWAESPQDDVAAEAAIAAAIGADRADPLLPILHHIRHLFGSVPEVAVPMIAEALNIGRAEVHGVISFRPDFRRQPAKTPVVEVCRAEACQAQGGAALAAADAAPSARVTVEPAAMVGDRPMAAATVEKLAEARANRSCLCPSMPWPGRWAPKSAPGR